VYGIDDSTTDVADSQELRTTRSFGVVRLVAVFRVCEVRITSIQTSAPALPWPRGSGVRRLRLSPASARVAGPAEWRCVPALRPLAGCGACRRSARPAAGEWREWLRAFGAILPMDSWPGRGAAALRSVRRRTEVSSPPLRAS